MYEQITELFNSDLPGIILILIPIYLALTTVTHLFYNYIYRIPKDEDTIEIEILHNAIQKINIYLGAVVYYYILLRIFANQTNPINHLPSIFMHFLYPVTSTVSEVIQLQLALVAIQLTFFPKSIKFLRCISRLIYFLWGSWSLYVFSNASVAPFEEKYSDSPKPRWWRIHQVQYPPRRVAISNFRLFIYLIFHLCCYHYFCVFLLLRKLVIIKIDV